MLFQVISKDDNKPRMSTDYASCIPRPDELKALNKRHTFKLNGKKASMTAVVEYLKEHKKEVALQ